MTGDSKTLLGYYSIMLGDRDFTAQLTAIKQLNPDVVVVPDDYAEVGLILKQARELGMTMPFLGGDAVDLPEIEGLQATLLRMISIFQPIGIRMHSKTKHQRLSVIIIGKNMVENPMQQQRQLGMHTIC